MSLPFVCAQLLVVHVSEITVWFSALQPRSTMAPPHVAAQLVTADGCESAVRSSCSAPQFGSSMASPLVHSELVLMDGHEVTTWFSAPQLGAPWDLIMWALSCLR